MWWRKKKAPGPVGITRTTALEACPIPEPDLQLEPLANGGHRVTVPFMATSRQRWLGAPEKYERTYELDQVGSQVLAWCDGKSTVAELITKAETEFGLPGEKAEKALTEYLQTLIGRGILTMQVPALEGAG